MLAGYCVLKLAVFTLLERTLFTFGWIEDPSLRRRVNAGLNKGKARNSLARAVFFNRLGESETVLLKTDATVPEPTTDTPSPGSLHQTEKIVR